MKELDDLFDSILEKRDGFPETDYRFTTLLNYISEISEFLEFTYAQKIQRLKAKIKSELDGFEKLELEGELNQLEEQGIEYLSHTIWGGVLLSVFATYESSILELFSFFEQKHGKPKFKNEKNKGFLDSANNYSKTHFNISLNINREDLILLKDLSKLRNSYVHNGCCIDDLPEALKFRVINREYKAYSLGIKDGKWLANAANTKLYFRYVYDSFSGYRRYLSSLLDAMPNPTIKQA